MVSGAPVTETPPVTPEAPQPKNLVWGRPQDRGYEYGIDRGVFYPTERIDGGWDDGVVWNGLASVDESLEGGTVDSFYIDGEKYLTTVGLKEYKALIRAYSPPPGFDACDGIRQVVPGFLVTGQSRDSFGFSYRTMVDGEGAYKIHLVYNATASRAQARYQTDIQSSTPDPQSWGITALPPEAVGYSPTAHFIIDTEKVAPGVVAWVENMIYGTVTDEAYLPPIGLLLGLMDRSRFVHVINSPRSSLLPSYVEEGDYVFVKFDKSAYSYGDPTVATDAEVRLVFVKTSTDLSTLPDTLLPGDLVFYEDTGALYQVGE